MRIAYLCSEYPKVSHTFIRREILELEARGHEVVRVSIRRGEVADPIDQGELERTFLCLEQPAARLAAGLIAETLRQPVRMARALRLACHSAVHGSRGWIRNAAYLAEAATILRHLREHDVQHVHAHFGSNAASVARLLHLLGGPPYSVMFHGPLEFDDPVGLEIGDKVRDAAFVTAITHYCSAQIRRWVDYPHWHKIHILHCTVSEDFFDPPAAIPGGPPTAVSVGRLSEQKGQLLLIDAMAELRDRGIDLQLRVFGDGELRPEIERRIAELDLADRITLEGWATAEQIRTALDECHGLLLPSFAEGLPVVIMESFARARPVVSTIIAGIPELVEHGTNGWLVPAGAVTPLVDAMADLATADRGRLARMGADGRQRVEAGFRATRELDRLESLLRKQMCGSAD